HAGAADVDLLDRLGLVDAGAGDGLLEGVEVDADQVDGLDAVALHGGLVVRVVAEGEQAAVDHGVQRLDAAAHDLGEAGDAVDGRDGDAGVGEGLGGAAGGDDLDAAGGQRPGEGDQVGLVGDGEEG